MYDFISGLYNFKQRIITWAYNYQVCTPDMFAGVVQALLQSIVQLRFSFILVQSR